MEPQLKTRRPKMETRTRNSSEQHFPDPADGSSNIQGDCYSTLDALGLNYGAVLPVDAPPGCTPVHAPPAAAVLASAAQEPATRASKAACSAGKMRSCLQ